MLDTFKRVLLESPLCKALIPAILAAAIGVFSGSLITEITRPDGLAWRDAHRTFSFYALAVLTVVQVLYSRLLYFYEQEVMRFADGAYCIAYVRAKCLPELATKAQARIRDGQGGEFEAAMEELKRVLR